MAAIDKLYYGTRAQYMEFRTWAIEKRPDILRFLFLWPDDYGYGTHIVAAFPESFDAWLLDNCPLEWVLEQIRSQYAIDDGGKPPEYDFTCPLCGSPAWRHEEIGACPG